MTPNLYPYDDSHERYRAVKQARPTPIVAQEIGVSVRALARYERGGYNRPATLDKIAAWVRAQENAWSQ
jgi:hypothetical protein